jgi:hypothetical protein
LAPGIELGPGFQLGNTVRADCARLQLVSETRIANPR